MNKKQAAHARTGPGVPASPTQFTERQAQFLAYIHQYTILHGRAPTEFEMQQFFQVTPPAVQSMMLALEQRGLIRRVPGRARSTSLLVPPEALPQLRRPAQRLATRRSPRPAATTPKVSEKLLKLVEEIRASGNASLTRLTVMKKWFARADRLSAFALWMAARASLRQGRTGGAAGDFFLESRKLLSEVDPIRPVLSRAAATSLYDRLRAFQNDWQNQQWGPVRNVHHWDLMLVEKGLGIWLWHANSPAHGYKLAADYCQNYDSRYGNGLNGPSGSKLTEIAGFMAAVEQSEDAST